MTRVKKPGSTSRVKKTRSRGEDMNSTSDAPNLVYKIFPVETVAITAEPTAAALLKALLPLYRADRDRWPLWTYRRTEGASNWAVPWEDGAGVPIWRDRLRWSSVLPLVDVWRILRRFAPEPLAYRPGRSELDGVSGGQRFGIPKFWQAYEAAILAAYAHPNVPPEPSAIVAPGTWSPTMPLDLEDYRELLHRFAAALQHGGGAMFLSLVWPRLDDRGRVAERAGGLELLERLGFAADRSRTRKNTLPAPYILELSNEARQIVQELRTWQVPAELAELTKALIEDADLIPLHSARLRRDLELHALPGRSATANAAIHLRFPFLTWVEVARLLGKSPGSVQSAADSLLKDRLAADITLRSLRDLIYRARA